jgi:hypothetical protein
MSHMQRRDRGGGGATAAAALRTYFCTEDMPVAALVLIECELCVYVLNTTLNQSARIIGWLLIVGYEAPLTQ